MSDIEFLKAQTRRLEARGMVIGGNADRKKNQEQNSTLENLASNFKVSNQTIKSASKHRHPRRGRKRKYQSNAARQRAYRDRRRSRVLQNRSGTGEF